MTEYGKLLKSLVDFSGVKLSTVAREVGYDLSYISKWCNSDKLPALRTAPEVNRAIAKLCGKEIVKMDAIEEFSGEFVTGHEVSVTSDSLEREISRLLAEAYDQSKKSMGKKHSSAFGGGAEVITRTSEIADFFARRLPQYLLDLNEPLEVLCTLDVCKFLESFNPGPQVSRLPQHDIKVRIGANQNTLISMEDGIQNLYFFINAKSHISFDIYDDQVMQSLNTIVVRDHLAVLLSLDQGNHITSLFITEDPDKANEIYEKVLPSFRTTDLLMHATDSDQFYKYGYRTDFYAQEKFQIFQPHGFEFLLPDECWDSIIKTAKKTGKDGEMAKVAEQMRITWNEMFEKASVDFFLLKSSLMKYMEDGELIFADVVYFTTPEERKLHIENTLRLAKGNKKIKFYVLDDDTFPGVQHLIRIAAYSNSKKMFLKCPDRYHMDNGPRFYSVLSDELIHQTEKFLDGIKESSFCYKFDGSNLGQFMEKYGSMVYRIIDLG